MKIAFYVAKYGDWTDLSIALGTLGPYSHVELVFSDGMFYSSSGRDGGVRYKKIDQGNHWTFFSLKVDEIEEQKIRKWCDTQTGCLYDWVGVARLVARMPKPSDDKWFCSEICMTALRQIGWLEKSIPSNYSPNSMCRLLKSKKLVR